MLSGGLERMARRLWNKNELLAALRLYCVTPFGRLHARNPKIIKLARELGRSPDAVALKMVNFASLDPTIDRKGMANVSSLDRQVWNEFFEQLSISLERDDEMPTGFSEADYNEQFYEEFPGLDVPAITNRRIRQGFFRKLVLASYSSKCAATGINASELLVAGHIIPWSKETSLRTNPRNGICLNYLFDRAFDRGLISVTDDWTLVYSPGLPDETAQRMKSMATEKLSLPERFRPDPAFFEYHRQNIFRA